MGYSPWGRKESDTTLRLICIHTYIGLIYSPISHIVNKAPTFSTKYFTLSKLSCKSLLGFFKVSNFFSSVEKLAYFLFKSELPR